MSGHSKWKTIKRVKGAADAKRSTVFSRLSKEIVIAVQVGGSPDPDFNPYLRVAINKAKLENLPNEKIENAINKGSGKANEGEQIFEKTYEALGPSGISLLIDCETDNPNRSITEIKVAVTRAGGKMVPEGSVLWQFDEKGLIKLEIKESLNKEEIENLELEMIGVDGVEDVEVDDHSIFITTKKELLRQTADQIKVILKDNGEINEVNIAKIAKNTLSISDEENEKLEEFLEKVKEVADVVNVWDNRA